MSQDAITQNEGQAGAILSFIRPMNEIVLFINEDRTIEAASDLACSVFGLGPDDIGTARIDGYFPSVYIDAIFSRVREEDTREMSMTFPVQNSSGGKVTLEARYSWCRVGERELLALICRDINYYMYTISNLTAREDLYRTIFHESPLGFIHINSDGIVADCNNVFLSIFGLARESVIGVCVADRTDADGWRKRFREEAMNAVMGIRTHYEDTYAAGEGDDAREGWVRVTFSPIMSDTNLFLGAVGIVEDITESKNAEKKIEYIGNHDALTGLFNRHACEQAMKEVDHPENFPIGIIYIDLNHLKLANDAFGHHEGDELLTKCAQILKANSAPKDTCFRLGGDEFLMLLPNTDRTALRTRTSNITKMCQNWKGDGIVQPSMAIGSAVKNFESQNMDDVVKEAEDTMYAVKLRNGPVVRKRLISTLENKLGTMINGAVSIRSRRMRLWGDWIVQNLDIPDDLDRANIKLLCRYHDIGMLAYTDELRTISISPARRRVQTPMQHMVVGYRIARVVADIGPVADYILSHHENWDGSGYPNQQSGKEIPYLSRIVAIFDAFEGMLSLNTGENRPSLEKALEALEISSGRLFDPELVVNIVGLLRKSPPSFIDKFEDLPPENEEEPSNA